MIEFRVDDMTCGHCASTITKALKAADQRARVNIDLPKHLVSIEPGDASGEELRVAIAEAGYSPVEITATNATHGRPASGGSCCGSCS